MSIKLDETNHMTTNQERTLNKVVDSLPCFEDENEGRKRKQNKNANIYISAKRSFKLPTNDGEKTVKNPLISLSYIFFLLHGQVVPFMIFYTNGLSLIVVSMFEKFIIQFYGQGS